MKSDRSERIDQYDNKSRTTVRETLREGKITKIIRSHSVGDETLLGTNSVGA